MPSPPDELQVKTVLHQVLDAAGDGFLDLDLHNGHAVYSARFKALLGYEPFELDDTVALWLELSHPDDREEADQKLMEHIEGSWPLLHTWRLLHKDGTWRWLMARGVTQYSPSTHEPERVIVFFSDISDRVLAERRLEALVAAMPDLLLRVTHDGTVLDAKFPPSVGEDRPRPLPGSNIAEWARAEGLAPTLLPMLDRVGAAQKSEITEIMSTGTGQNRSYEAHVVLGAEGELVCILRDVTARRRLESQVQQTQRLESIGQLAAGIAHEINTPVQFVSDSVHFLRDAVNDILSVVASYRRVRDCGPPAGAHPEMEEALREAADVEVRSDMTYLEENVGPALERAIEGLERISTIVRSVKEFAHPATGEKSPTDLNRALMATLTIARSEYKDVAEIETRLGDLPHVSCLPGEINQAILNILVNASHAIADRVKATGTRGRITVTTRRVDGFAELAIADTGGGIPEQFRHRVFEPFFTTKEVGRGTGQGLALSRTTIVEKHQGTLTFETEMGTGTTFFIRLPLTPAAEA